MKKLIEVLQKMEDGKKFRHLSGKVYCVAGGHLCVGDLEVLGLVGFNTLVDSIRDGHFEEIIEPVYEWQVVYRGTFGGFELSIQHYKSQDEFEKTNNTEKFIEFYEPSKRERKI